MNPFIGKYGPLLIAEIGGNHEGNFEYAKQLVSLAIESDADYVKLQLYTGDSLVNPVESPDRNKHFKKFELSKDQYIELAEKVISAGKKFTASVWNEDFFDWIDPYMSLYKIGSGDLTAYPLLKRTAEVGKPIILSTGLSAEKEILEAVNFIQTIDKKYKDPEWLGVLQCTSMYPINHSDVNLAVMERLKELTNLTIGFSDHTIGTKALQYAVTRGAQILEFHFTDSRENKSFRDHLVSLTKDEVYVLIEEIKLIKSLIGNPKKEPLPVEIENGHVASFRRGVYPRMDISANTIIGEQHLITLRPNHGISARSFYELIGKKCMVDLKQYQKLDWTYFK